MAKYDFTEELNAILVDPVLIDESLNREEYRVNFVANTVTADFRLQTPDGSTWGVTFKDMPRNNSDWNLVIVQDMIQDRINSKLIIE